ncbi:hypothetical protein CI109_107317 [Kwoniella shandongensis]|uniref:Uncharacterized protein n=1 Tax=Kwoniella shandongensis TaxID=1734106 RepID=A0A5M6BVT5_9TREE|nr:uncharacterized protein CI109_004755 [Kwoniella shandongensis]KAA5526978.1 hypothetical protein CI109_004755 [Kwoniella shandongensis]
MTTLFPPTPSRSPSFPSSSDTSSAGSSSKWSVVRNAVKVASVVKEQDKLRGPDSLSVSTPQSSASAALARSFVLFAGFLFRRPSKLFKPNRVDTWAGLRSLAISSDQTLSPSFIRNLLRRKSGIIALTLTLLPPMMVNTTLGFLLFTSHSLFSLGLARLTFFQRKQDVEDEVNNPTEKLLVDQANAQGDEVGAQTKLEEGNEHQITLETLFRGPSVIPYHPTLLSALAGAGAGIVQGAAFTPVENVVRFLHQSTSSLTLLFGRLTGLPLPNVPPAFDASQPATPLQAIRNLFSSDAWRKNPSWWTGWRWAIARDALSYSCFFAAFDMTRRVSLRMKALFGGNIEKDWDNFLVIDFPSDSDRKDSTLSSRSMAATHNVNAETKPSVPTIARVAQATTIVTGGIMASLLAEFVGRPFRACQRIMQLDTQARSAAQVEARMASGMSTNGNVTRPVVTLRELASRRPNPIIQTFVTKGFRPFLYPDNPPSPTTTKPIDNALMRDGRMKRMVKRVGWRLAAVGPWGFGFLVWAWVGGEV